MVTTIVAGAALLLGTPTNAHADSSPARDDDVHILHCLGEAHRVEVARAAVRLGVARATTGDVARLSVEIDGRTRTLTVEAWAKQRRDDFRRVCSAFIEDESLRSAEGSGQDQSGGSEDLQKSALLLAVGAGLTLLVQLTERDTARRRARREALDTAGSAYTHQAESFLGSWAGNPNTPHDEVSRARVDLVNALRGLPGWRARRGEACALAERLPLRDPPEAAINREAGRTRQLNRDERREVVAQLRSVLAAVMPEVEATATTAFRWYPRHLRTLVTRHRRREGRTGGDDV